jgi:NAD(P)-dependent dehydrogenase (short-subunit alcohol dehydrogenase family)
MGRICVVTGSASGIGAATASLFRRQGCRVIGDLHDADVVADLATTDGRAAFIRGVSRLAGGRVDAVVANAGGGSPETSLSLNFFGAVATLQGLRPLLANSPAPRAVAVSSIASLRSTPAAIVEKCLHMDEPGAIAAAETAFEQGSPGVDGTDRFPDSAQTPLDLYGAAKQALQHWCRRVAPTREWAGAGIILNAVALGFYDTPAAAYVLSNPGLRAAMAALAPLRGSFPGRPQEAAALLAWCISPENSQMTGQVLFADGGYEAQLQKDRVA